MQVTLTQSDFFWLKPETQICEGSFREKSNFFNKKNNKILTFPRTITLGQWKQFDKTSHVAELATTHPIQ